jgi:hypothetical protein
MNKQKGYYSPDLGGFIIVLVVVGIILGGLTFFGLQYLFQHLDFTLNWK